MDFTKSSSAMVALFGQVVPTDPEVERRQMFGYPCAFVGGNLVMGTHKEDLFLRLDEVSRKALEKQGGIAFAPMPGRPMREYVVVPKAMLENRAELVKWVAASLKYGKTLAPKAKKARAKG